MFAFQLVSEALDVSLAEGKARWDQGLQRLKRRELPVPATTQVKPDGARKKTPQLAANDAAKALVSVLKNPLDFFENVEKLSWLRGKVLAAGGNPATVDEAAAGLLAEKKQREADAVSLLPVGLSTQEPAPIRTSRKDGEVLGYIFDYLRFLGVKNVKQVWDDWLGEEFRTGRISDQFEINRHPEIIEEQILYTEEQEPGDHAATPKTNYPGFCLLTKLCLHKSIVAQNMADDGIKLLGKVSVGDQRLHTVLNVNAAGSSNDARSFVLGTQEAIAQEALASKPVNLEDFERRILEDDNITPETAARRLAKAALVRQYRESSCQHLDLVKRQKTAETEKCEAEAKAATEQLQAETSEVCATKAAAAEKSRLEHARLIAEKQKVEDEARAEAEERERQRIHAAELAAEKRKEEIRQAAAKGDISEKKANDLLGERQMTQICRFETWIRIHLRCQNASGCSSQLSRDFNDAVTSGRHIKPQSHRDELNRWKLYEEHDGAILSTLHQELHDRRNGIQPGQRRLFA